jgi:hypothetical protein
MNKAQELLNITDKIEAKGTSFVQLDSKVQREIDSELEKMASKIKKEVGALAKKHGVDVKQLIKRLTLNELGV